ncbi:MAG: TetR family transcriptional regulator [Bdellovibrionales bacterium]|nr:TetR family transcriptional regulator [Bdellovibrionales bacterium]
MTTKQIKTKNKDRLATEERLLNAAEQVFSKYGFKGATTRMIAKKADVNVALIARYFDGKYGLMIKFIEKKAIECHFIELNYPPQETLLAECLEFAKQRLLFFVDDMNLFKIVMVQFLTDPKFLKKFHESLIIFETHPAFKARLDVFIEDKNIIPNIDAPQIIDIIEDYIFSIVMTKILIDNISVDEAQKHIERFISVFCRGLEIKATDT